MSFKLNHALFRPVFIATTSSLLLLVGVLANAGCQQPGLNCTVYHGYYAASYELVSGDETSACGMLTGDILGLNAYYADAGGRPNLEDGSMAIRPQYVNSYVFHALYRGVADLSTDENTQSVGDFDAGIPGAGDFCEAPSPSTAQLTIPDVPEQLEVMDDPDTEDVDETVPPSPALPTTTVSYEWRDVRVLVNADAQGTQFSAELHFEQDGCAADYHVTALYPAIPCMTDEDCDDDANGINPGFATVCNLDLAGPARYYMENPDLTVDPNQFIPVGPVQYYLGDPTFTGGLCVLAEDPPSYK